MRRLGFSLLFRQRRMVELVATMAVFGLIAFMVYSSYTLTEQRTLVGGHRAYEQLRKTADLRAKCRRYIHLTGKDEPALLKSILEFDFNNLVFKEDRYKREKVKGYKNAKKLTTQQQWDEQADIDFKKDMEQVFLYSQKLELHVHNMKVWGKCMLDHDYGAHKCADLQRNNYPWISGEWPIFENYNGTVWQDEAKGCLLKNLRGNGVGIVIPVVPSMSKDKEIDSILRLIRLLRAQGNNLPIQVVHYDLLSVYDKKHLVQVARVDKADVSKQNLPLQDVTFVDVKPTVKKQLVDAVFSSSTFVHALSALFNTFEDAIIMTSKMVPLVDNFDVLLQSPLYTSTGILNFRIPSKLLYRPAKFVPGFHEIEKIILSRLLPGEFEYEYFEIQLSSTIDMKHFFDDDFERVIDPTLMIVNKKTTNGILMALNLQLYQKFLTPRLGTIVDDDLKIIGEYMWIGQAIAGRSNVHWQDAVIAGIKTPSGNVEQRKATTAIEVCSLSWGQMIDHDLLYVTSHQLEAARDDGTTYFDILKKKFELHEKKLVPNADTSKPIDPLKNEFEDVVDATVVDALRENPLKMEVIIEPPRLLSPVYSPGAREPKLGWEIQDYENLNDHQYWCGYNLAGNPATGKRGRTWSISSDLQQKYSQWIGVWYSYARF